MTKVSASGSANGKVILLGEHAVVYGAPALAVGIDRGAHATATRRDAGPSSLALGDRLVVADANGEDDLARAFAALLGETAPVDAHAKADLPPGGGLGCSAALGVALARAVLELDAPPSEDLVIARANAWERIFHGNPSGIDTAAAMHGGCFVYSRAEGVRHVAPPYELELCIGWSGSGSSTKTMVDSVARLRTRRPEIVDRSVEGITSLVKNAALAIEAGDHAALGKLMDLNQMILAGLMLSTESIEAMCTLARQAGAFGAKLTGAGGGGSVVALVPAKSAASGVADRVLESWNTAGYSGFLTSVEAKA